MYCYHHLLIVLIIEESLFSQFPSFSIIVPITIISAPALAISFAVSGCTNSTACNEYSFIMFSYRCTPCCGEIFCIAPEPASRYKNLIPRYCAAREYMTAIPDLLKGTPRARPTNHAVVSSPIIK